MKMAVASVCGGDEPQGTAALRLEALRIQNTQKKTKNQELRTKN
jgi:hypothetical protein